MRQQTKGHREATTYDSDKHMYITSPGGKRIRAYYVGHSLYMVETHSPGGKRGQQGIEWDVPIGLVRRNPVTRHFEAFSALRHTTQQVRGVSAGIKQLAAEYDRLMDAQISTPTHSAQECLQTEEARAQIEAAVEARLEALIEGARELHTLTA